MHLAGLVPFFWSGWGWIVLAGGGFALLRAMKGGRRHQLGPPPPQPQIPAVRRSAGSPSRQPSVEVRRALPEMSRLAAHRLPPSVQMKVGQIRRKVEAILQYSAQFPVGSEELYLVEHTATDYLPRTLDAYLRLPPAAHNQPVEPGGRTAWEELWSQLNLMEQKLDEVARQLQRANADQLLANGRFLEERFKKASELDSATEKS